ncbi:hypothetical protein OAF65_09685 [Verrucomicrobiales bacterium]|nr:hypothetical protein [Verrucomicrobiales bacterium]
MDTLPFLNRFHTLTLSISNNLDNLKEKTEHSIPANSINPVLSHGQRTARSSAMRDRKKMTFTADR